MDRRASIVIATYGDPKWQRQAERVALPSAKLQGDFEIILYHDPDAISPAEPRNVAAAAAQGERIVFVDADDEIENGYVSACLGSTGGIRYPRVRYIPEDWNNTKPLPQPSILPKRDLTTGNFLVIGSMMIRSHLLQVGGFSEWETYEDWYTFLKLTYLGDVPVLCMPAVYRVYKHHGSRVHATKDPVGLCRAITEGFRRWAYDFNGGVTSNPHYKAFLAKGRQDIEPTGVLAMDRKAD